jgi:hypothetical protein
VPCTGCAVIGSGLSGDRGSAGLMDFVWTAPGAGGVTPDGPGWTSVVGSWCVHGPAPGPGTEPSGCARRTPQRRSSAREAPATRYYS